MKRNPGTRALLLIFADSLRAQSERICFIVDQIDKGIIDPDTIPIVTEDIIETAADTLEVTTPTTTSTTPKRSGPPVQTIIKSAKVCPVCRARDFRTTQKVKVKFYKCFACGYIPTGERLARRDGDDLTSRPCPKCSSPAYRNVTRRIDGKRLQCRICEKCGHASSEEIKRMFAIDIMQRKAEQLQAQNQEVPA